MKLFCSVALILLTAISVADGLSGTYEFPPPEGMEGDSAIVQLDKDEEGSYHAQVSVADETIEGKNVVVGENQFSFDIEVDTRDGDMLQAYTVKFDEGEVSLSILSELGGRSESMTFKGKLIEEIEGTYTFPPPEGGSGDTTNIQLEKDDEDNFSVSVTVGEETIETTNVRVNNEEFSFDTETETQIGKMKQAWKVQVSDGEATLSVLADISGQSQSMTLTGTRVNEKIDQEN